MDRHTEIHGEPIDPEAIRKRFASNRLGKQIHYLKEVDSTNVFAYRRAQNGGVEGEIVIAEAQTQGKGRLGRRWVSPSSLNLYLSIILRPTLAPSATPQITLASAVAVAEAVESFLSSPPEIKWPNDILVEGKKLGGILTESCCDRDRVVFVILGVGVNLNFPFESMPEWIREQATSLMILSGTRVDRTAFACRLIQNLDRCYGELSDKGFAFLGRRWESYFRLKGRKVRVANPDHPVWGKAVGIDGDGALLLEDERGRLQRIVAGDVIPLDA